MIVNMEKKKSSNNTDDLQLHYAAYEQMGFSELHLSHWTGQRCLHGSYGFQGSRKRVRGRVDYRAGSLCLHFGQV